MILQIVAKDAKWCKEVEPQVAKVSLGVFKDEIERDGRKSKRVRKKDESEGVCYTICTNHVR